MDTRRRVFLLALLFAAGFAVAWGWFAFGPSERREARRVHQDTMALVPLVRPTPWLEDVEEAPEYREWLERREDAPPERLSAVRERLHAYLDLYVAEYADAAAIYETGRSPDERSRGAQAARERFRELFGELGDKVLEEFGKMREVAYRNSPRTARGVDPALTNFTDEWRALREWEPLARRRVDALTDAR